MIVWEPHTHDQRPTHCDQCGLRWPCDYEDMRTELERLNAVAYEAALMAGWNDKTIREAGLRDPDDDPYAPEGDNQQE